DQEATWQSFGRPYSGKRATLGTVIDWAKEGGWDGKLRVTLPNELRALMPNSTAPQIPDPNDAPTFSRPPPGSGLQCPPVDDQPLLALPPGFGLQFPLHDGQPAGANNGTSSDQQAAEPLYDVFTADKLLSTRAPPRRWCVDPFIPQGEVTLLA